MKFGIHYSIGVNANPEAEDYIRVAQKAEECGYHSLWLGDHIVIPEKIEAAYPYSADGATGFPRRAPFPDPFVLLGGLALATSRILLGTSVIVIPYRNPLAVAKAVTTVDLLSHGRFQFGVGVGWLKEEFDALGEDFARRARQTREYLHIMKTTWQAEPASFSGEFLKFQTFTICLCRSKSRIRPLFSAVRVCRPSSGWPTWATAGSRARPPSRCCQKVFLNSKPSWLNADETMPTCPSRP